MAFRPRARLDVGQRTALLRGELPEAARGRRPRLEVPTACNALDRAGLLAQLLVDLPEQFSANGDVGDGAGEHDGDRDRRRAGERDAAAQAHCGSRRM